MIMYGVANLFLKLFQLSKPCILIQQKCFFDLSDLMYKRLNLPLALQSGFCKA